MHHVTKRHTVSLQLLQESNRRGGKQAEDIRADLNCGRSTVMHCTTQGVATRCFKSPSMPCPARMHVIGSSQALPSPCPPALLLPAWPCPSFLLS
jgi:hypothetical protein